MAWLEKFGRLARLGGILGLAIGSLAVSACGSRSVGQGDGQAGSDDAALDAGVDAATVDDGGTETPDARLWDVLCE